MIYVLSPYTHKNKHIMEKRYRMVLQICAHYTKKTSIILYSPIIYYHPMAVKYDLPKDYNYWRDINKHYLEIATGAAIALMPGWEISVGMKAEYAYTKKLELPIYKISADNWKPNNKSFYTMNGITKNPWGDLYETTETEA